MKNSKISIEKLIFSSRWLLAPFFIGLIFALFILLGKFIREFIWLGTNCFNSTASESIISILTLLDTTLIACLVLIVVLSGYEIFVSKINLKNHEDKPSWMGKVSFSDLKLKLITAVIAISTVELLRAIINIKHISNEVMAWKIGVHVTFVFTGIIFALTDLIASKKGNGH